MLQNVQDAGAFGDQFHRGFVGFDLNDRLADFDGLATLLQPLQDTDFADGLSHGRGIDLMFHDLKAS